MSQPAQPTEPAAARPAHADAADPLAGPEPGWAPAELPLAQPLNTLAIDTSSDTLSLALLSAGGLAGARYEAMGRRTTQAILPEIGALLADARLGPRDLDVLVVARGPGSFTGTRIGMAVALTFAQVTGATLVGVDTLRLLAAQSEPTEGPAFPVLLNCARDEVYTARYRWSAGALARESGMALRRLGSLLPELEGEPVVLRRFHPGVGADAETEAAFAALPQRPLRYAQPDAVRLLTVGLGRYLGGKGSAGERVEPIYLKSEAFRTWRPGS